MQVRGTPSFHPSSHAPRLIFPPSICPFSLSLPSSHPSHLSRTPYTPPHLTSLLPSSSLPCISPRCCCSQAVLINLQSVGRIAQTLPGYSGPVFGAKVATANHREFTEDQLRAGRNAMSLTGKGSHGKASQVIGKIACLRTRYLIYIALGFTSSTSLSPPSLRLACSRGTRI